MLVHLNLGKEAVKDGNFSSPKNAVSNDTDWKQFLGDHSLSLANHKEEEKFNLTAQHLQLNSAGAPLIDLTNTQHDRQQRLTEKDKTSSTHHQRDFFKNLTGKEGNLTSNSELSLTEKLKSRKALTSMQQSSLQQPGRLLQTSRPKHESGKKACQPSHLANYARSQPKKKKTVAKVDQTQDCCCNSRASSSVNRLRQENKLAQSVGVSVKADNRLELIIQNCAKLTCNKCKLSGSTEKFFGHFDEARVAQGTLLCNKKIRQGNKDVVVAVLSSEVSSIPGAATESDFKNRFAELETEKVALCQQAGEFTKQAYEAANEIQSLQT